MKANPMILKLAGIASIAVAGSLAAIACSSSSNPAPSNETTLEAGSGEDSGAGSSGGSSGSSGGSSGSSSGSSGSSGGSSGSSGGSSGSSNGASSGSSGGPLCVDGGSVYNTCSPFGCAGYYDNAAHGVPNPVPKL